MAARLAQIAIATLVAALAVAPHAEAGELTALETRWIEGIWPVVRFAREQKLPLDVIVQPQDEPDAPPLALGYVDGRCKLVLSMRGNAEAQATLDRIDGDLVEAALELMAAHELGHCRRYLDGTWFGGGARFAADDAAGGRSGAAEQAAIRREEAYADLVGLGWARLRRPHDYRRLHAWLVDERTHELVPGGTHDTLAWIRLAGDADALAGGSIFGAATRLWSAMPGAQAD
jgi:hypothetical protein